MHYKHHNFENGELVVMGHNTVEIHLHSLPRQTEVKFKKLPDPSPCDHPHHHHHHHHDKLDWEVVRIHHHHTFKYSLVITWDVKSVREIMWSVNY